jgi:hypothetical protein
VTPGGSENLPLWRLILGVMVLGSLAAVLLALAPVYLENYRLERYLREIARAPARASIPDETVRSEVLERAKRLHLPVKPSDIEITHQQGKMQVRMRYAVQMDFSLYQVDLHFHPGAASP